MLRVQNVLQMRPPLAEQCHYNMMIYSICSHQFLFVLFALTILFCSIYFLFIFFSEEELATPPLDGIILPGVTRQSVLELTKKWVSKTTP